MLFNITVTFFSFPSHPTYALNVSAIHHIGKSILFSIITVETSIFFEKIINILFLSQIFNFKIILTFGVGWFTTSLFSSHFISKIFVSPIDISSGWGPLRAVEYASKI